MALEGHFQDAKNPTMSTPSEERDNSAEMPYELGNPGPGPGAFAHCHAMALPGLYLGSSMAERDISCLVHHGITHVVQVASELSPNHPGRFTYLNLEVEDSEYEDLVTHMPKAFEFIDNALKDGGRVLVHCLMGISRSTTIVCGYMMCTQKTPFPATLASIKALRRCVDPNHGFRLQLQLLEDNAWQLQPWGGWSAQHYQAEVTRRGLASDGATGAKMRQRMGPFHPWADPGGGGKGKGRGKGNGAGKGWWGWLRGWLWWA